MVAGVMVPLAQVQGLEEVSWTAILGTVGMLLTVVVAFMKLAWVDPPAARVPMERVHTGNFKASLVAFLDIVFTYGGQVRCCPSRELKFVRPCMLRNVPAFVHASRIALVSACLIVVVKPVMGTEVKP